MMENASVLYYILAILFIIVSIGLMTVILLQKKRTKGLGNLGAVSSDTYWDRNKSNSMEGALEKYTKIFGFLFFILAFAMAFVR